MDTAHSENNNNKNTFFDIDEVFRTEYAPFDNLCIQDCICTGYGQQFLQFLLYPQH